MPPSSASLPPDLPSKLPANLPTDAVGLLPGQPVSSPPPEESPWRVGTLAYTKSGLIRLCSWLLWGDFAWSVRDRSLGDVLKYLLTQLHASDFVTALLVSSIPATIGLVLGPIISFRSDRFRGRRGRRIPFLLVSAPVAAVAVFGLGFSPVLGEWLHGVLGQYSPGPFPCALIVLGAWWVVFDFATTIANSIFGALINDTVPHGVIGRFFGMFRAISLLVGIAFNYYLLKKATVHYQWMFASVGAIYGIGVVLMCLKVREGEYPPPPPAEEGGPLGRFFRAAGGYFKESFTKPYFLWYFAASSLGMLATSPPNLFNLAFANSLHVDLDNYGIYLAITYATSLVLTYPLGMLADRFHPLRVGMVVIGLYGLSTLWGAAFATSPGAYGVALITHGVMSGTYYTVAASLAQRLLPQAKFAQIASAGGIISSLLGIVTPLLLGKMLDFAHHDYRLAYLAASVLSFLALGCMAQVYRYWLRYGGPHHFVAPV